MMNSQEIETAVRLKLDLSVIILTDLTECVNSPGVHLIDVPVDYSENARVLTRELNEKTCIV
jgi:acetolactate synthase-1/2/3 large subunit